MPSRTRATRSAASSLIGRGSDGLGVGPGTRSPRRRAAAGQLVRRASRGTPARERCRRRPRRRASRRRRWAHSRRRPPGDPTGATGTSSFAVEGGTVRSGGGSAAIGAQRVSTTTMIASQATVAIDWTIQNDWCCVLWRIPKNTIHAPTKPPARHSSHSVRSRIRRPSAARCQLVVRVGGGGREVDDEQPPDQQRAHRPYSAPRVDGGNGFGGRAVPTSARHGRRARAPGRRRRARRRGGPAASGRRARRRRPRPRTPPTARKSSTSSSSVTPPIATTGMSTTCATSYTTRSATGLIAGPESPP